MEPIKYYSLTDQVYDALKRDIIQRTLAANAKLDVNGLALQLGVSRMPVVDALNRLENEGLVEKRNRVGTFVTPVSQRMFIEWFEMRGMIEDWATPRIVANISDDSLQQLRGLLDEGNRILRIAKKATFGLNVFNERFDYGFHVGLIRECDNTRIADTFASIHTHSRIGRSFVEPDDRINACKRSQGHHELIMQAFTERDTTKATNELRKHRENSLQGTLDRLQRQGIA